MKTEQDKSDPNLYITSGTRFGHRIIAEGDSPASAMSGYLTLLSQRLKKDAISKQTQDASHD